MNAHASTARAERTAPLHIGEHLREWRQRRHLSQLDLAVDADISARHLSFVETGRSAPSREMVLKLAERLDVPLRERNVLRLAFHPEGLAPRTVNLAEWAAHLLERLHRQCEATADPELLKLYQDLKSHPIPARSGPVPADSVAIPFKLRHQGEVLSFISTTMVFGTPVDITLSELALETFFAADELTAVRMRNIASHID